MLLSVVVQNVSNQTVGIPRVISLTSFRNFRQSVGSVPQDALHLCFWSTGTSPVSRQLE